MSGGDGAVIFNLLTDGQWFVVWFLTWLLLSTLIEIWMARGLPWSSRERDDPPPIVGGLVMGFLAALLLAGLLGLIHGLTWMWLYG